MRKSGLVSKEVFKALGFRRVSEDFFKPFSNIRTEISYLLLDEKPGYFVYQKEDKETLIFCYSSKDKFGIRLVIVAYIRDLNSSYWNWQLFREIYFFLDKENSKYLSAKVRTITKQLSKSMDSKETLSKAFEKFRV